MAVNDASCGEFHLVDDWISDIDKLSIIGGATFHIGQSMHGFISALAQSRLSGLCMNFADDKFSEVLRDTGFHHARVSRWEEIERLVDTIVSTSVGPIFEKVVSYQAHLDQELDIVCNSIKKSFFTKS